MWTLIFAEVIPGAPVQLNRARHGKYGVYHDPKNKQQKRHIINLLLESCPVGIQIGPNQPMGLVVEFIHKRPVRLNRRKDTSARIPKTTKPDVDNLIKMIMDALQETPLLHDDKQVIMICASDWWAAKGEQPHTQIGLFSQEPYNA
jgi:Holliday junction resolvase RusA-like endonuclease